MTTLYWLLPAACYLVIATMIWRRAAWAFADKERLDPLQRFTSFEIIWGLLAGALFASVWPLTLSFYAIRRHGIPLLGSHFLLPPTEIRLEQQARRSEERARRIAELERQAEIR